MSTAKLKLLVVLSEGEIQGDLTAQQIFLNDIPLANDSGTYNFNGVKWEYRKGTQDQTYIDGMPEVSNEMSAGVTVTTTAPWVRQFTNLSLDAVRVKLSLPAQYQYKENGDMVGTVAPHRDAIDLGIVTEQEKMLLSEWRSYREQLMRMDIRKPDWPVPPGESQTV